MLATSALAMNKECQPVVVPDRLLGKASGTKASSATMPQVWLDQYLVGRIPGCSA